jgi:electron transport complex protein RnfG
MLLLRPTATLAASAALLTAAVLVSLRADGITREEALAAVYPGATVRAEQVFLTPEQQQQAAARAGGDVPSAFIARYIATQDGRVVGRAYIDTHIVRTKKETLLISLDADGRVKRVDVTAFLEPTEYKASDAWLRQYGNRRLDEELGLNRAIRPIAGATLTARATNAAVRRVLAVDAVLSAAGSSK